MRWFVFSVIVFLAFSCAKRPGDTDAGSIFDRWLASQADNDEVADDVEVVPDAEEDVVIEESVEIIPEEDVIPEHGIVEEEPDLIEEEPDKDSDAPDEPPDVVPDEDADVDCTMTCTTDTFEDPCSGIVWQREANYSGAQENGASFCTGLAGFGGYAKWRLPTLAELKTLRRGCDTDMGCADIGVCYWDHNLLGACDKEPWSSTSAGGDAYYAVNFRTGEVRPLPGTSNLLVRCMADNR